MAIPKSRARFHLLWTVPFATVLAIPFWVYGAIALCGISGCSGGGFGTDYDYQSRTWICCAVIGVLYFLSLAFIPWLRPWLLRVILSAAIGCLIGAVVAFDFASALR